MPVNIVGGNSASGQISILSDEFTATAQSDKDGRITCNIQRHSRLSRFFYKHKRFPIPRLIRLMLFLVNSLTRKGRLILGICLLGLVLIAVLLQKYLSGSSTFLGQYLWVTNVTVTFGALLYIRRHIATWHGAEHMAIAAYERTGSTDIKQISQESRVDDDCGGRLFPPFIAVTIVAKFVAISLGVNYTIVYLIALECMLWVDTLKGWDKIPGTSHASRLLQKYITTRTPGTQELLVAQRALQELIATHNK